MRNLLSVLVAVCLVSAALSRPAVRDAEENEEETEYENEVERADAEELSEGLQEPAGDEAEEEETQLDHQRQIETNRNTRANDEQRAKLADYNHNMNSARQYAIEEESEQNENSEYNSAVAQAEQAVKNKNSVPSEQYLLESEERSHADKSAETNDHNQEQLRESKTYYKAEEPRDQYSKKSNIPLQNARYRSQFHADINRNIREIQSNESLNISKADEEDEEAAIKRQINKLSAAELNQFMDTLTEDKRELLKKIVDSNDNAQVNKREITKETSAVEVNNFSARVTQQHDPYKEEKSASVDSPTTTLEVNNKQQMPQPDAKSVHLFKKDTQNETTTAVIDNSSDQFSLTLTVSNLNNQVTISQEPIKTEIKREARAESEPMEAEDSECDEDVEEDSQCEKQFKQEAHDQNYLDSIKSLEESFPNPDSYEEDDQSGSDLTPLVRVKRNHMKKRAAGILPDAKSSYCPCEAENDNEDAEEGNEFDGEGFYERSPNLINDKEAALADSERSKLSEPKNMKTDIASIGSDTEGVGSADENLMLNSVRGKRTLTKESNGKPAVLNHNSDRVVRSQPGVKDNAKFANPDNNSPHYHENDAFGALPRNYEGELGRHKRIRHVKQPLAQSDSSDQ